MQNKWISRNLKNYLECKSLLKRENLLKIDLDGKKIHTKNEFMEQIENKLFFPSPCEGKYARFEDWIRDLSWLPKEQGICISIKNYQYLLKEDDKAKRIFEDIFKNEVLPFWEEEAPKYIKGAKTREFFVITC